MTATAVIMAALSPLLVALIRRCTWPQPAVEILSFAVVLLLYVLAQYLDGVVLTIPLTSEFWTGLAAAWGIQQASYKAAWKHSKPVQTLEEFQP